MDQFFQNWSMFFGVQTVKFDMSVHVPLRYYIILLKFWVICCSVFEGHRIPYPKREFLTDDDSDDKPNTGASKVGSSSERLAVCAL